ncbi:hypothetical protein AGOR_G00152560 [Albula goreensis]|uniref:Uncharacterized protein n=1 Tax=Albula goreensis TaxID=1534307 RepID=A0A8T3D3Q9_9TELE|nr:hypothetical protein AGOR_G00152560 [Albula goreensis]
MEREPEEADMGGRGVAEPEHGRSRIAHNALENMGALGQGFKQLFQHQRRRSSISPHDVGSALPSAPEPLEAGPETGNPPHPPDPDPPPAALSRVLQQVMKRGASLQSRRQPASDPPKAGPQSRPRSASTTETPFSPALLETPLLSADSTTPHSNRLEVSGLAMGLVPVEGGCPTDDVPAASPVDPQRSRQQVAQLQQKILRLTEQIRVEQAARDDNVAEYLKLATNADRQQGARIKQVFEKKNQKSTQTVLQLQRKLDTCQRKLREAEQGGAGSGIGPAHSRQHKVHQGPRDTAASRPAVTKLARARFGSTENVWQEEQGDEAQSNSRCGSEDEGSTATSGSVGGHSATGAGNPTPGLRAAQEKQQGLGSGSVLDMLLRQLQEAGRAQTRLEEALDKLKGHYERDYQLLMQALQDQRFRCERLEEQLNDLMELHQNEVLNLKQELASVEEKIAYQSYERGRDVQEALEACQTRICKMELQQQQSGQLDGLEARAARPLLAKLISVLLALMAVLLVCVSTAASCTAPLLKTRCRTLGSLILLGLVGLVWRNWDSLSPHLHLDHLLELYASASN